MSEDPVFGGTLRILASGSIQSFDPLWTTASGTGNVSNTILEGLFEYTSDYGIAPLLIDSWEASPDGMSWQFRIRDGITFHDGTPFTTEQVLGTLGRQQDRAPVLRLVRNEFGANDGDFASFVTADDNLAFTVHLREATGLVIDAMGPQGFGPRMVTADWYDNYTANESAEGPPNGTGPFKFEEWVPGDRWSATRFEDYNPHPSPADGLAGGHTAYVDRMIYLEVPDQTTRVAALQVGEVDMVQEFPAELVSRLEADPNVALYDQPPLRLLGHFNHLLAPWKDNPQARQAFVRAYDNQKALTLATGDPAFTRLCPSLLQCGTKWETASGSEGLYAAQDIAGAKQQLLDAGVVPEETVIRLMDPADRQPAHAAAQVSRETFEALGFQVDFQVMDWATMVSQRARPDDWEFFHTWSGVTVRSGPVGHLLFAELQYDAWFNNYQDTTGKQREIFSRLARATSEDDQIALNNEFNQFFFEDAIFLQVGEFFSRWAASTDVHGIVSGAAAQQHPFDKWLTQ
jgi:peptide/nickel transport system substrate-binding protein